MHLHGAGRKPKHHSQWPGILVLTVMGILMIMAIIRIGWLAFGPFIFAAFILGIALWLMRTLI